MSVEKVLGKCRNCVKMAFVIDFISILFFEVFEDSKETFYKKVSLVGFGVKPKNKQINLRPLF
jgi:hypothetical protein